MAPETPRGVSSRLLTMKFMQRAAASASSAGSPESDTHSAKKRKLGHPASEGRINANFDQASIKAALDEQEAKRLAALAQHSAADTHWVLNNTLSSAQGTKTAKAPMKIIYVGYGEIDSSNDSGDNEDEPQQGRTSTNDYKQSSAKEKKPSDASDDNDSGSDESGQSSPGRELKSSWENTEHSARSRSQSRSRPKQGAAESAKAKEFREKRKKKEVRLNKLTSISSAGDNQFGSGSSPGGKSFNCYKCHKPGHKAVDCSKSGPPRQLSMR